MFALAYCREGDGRQRSVERGHNDGADGWISERVLVIGNCDRTRISPGQFGGATRIEVARVAQLSRLQPSGALTPDDAAADNGKLEWSGHCCANFLPRSSGTMRRRV